jgi:O-antigen/teichoic acid export membrane protein
MPIQNRDWRAAGFSGRFCQEARPGVSGTATENGTNVGGLDRARAQGVSVAAIRIGGAGLALAAQILASRLLGADDFGRYSLLLVWLLVVGYAATAGSGQLLCRYVAHYVKAADRQSLAGLLRAGLVAVVAVSALLALTAISTLALLPGTLDRGTLLLSVLAFAAVPLVALQDYLESIARGLDWPALGIGPAFFGRHLGVIAGLLALIILGRDATALAVMSFTIAGLLASILTQYALLRRHLRPMLAGVAARYHIGRWIRTALPLAGTDVTEMLLLNADVLILGLFVAPEQVAFYFAATRIAQILAYVPYSATAATAQKFAKLSAPADRAELQALIGRTATLSTLATAFGALLLSLYAAPLLSLFGEDFAAAAPIVMLLSLGIFVSCALGPGEDVLNMLGEERICSIGFLLALLVNLALNFALIPLFGLAGAAIATLSALALRGALLAAFARLRLGLVLPAIVSLAPATAGHREVPHEA